MGAVVAAVMGIACTLPINPIAFGAMLNLSGIAAGAAAAGCSAQMIGFAAAGLRENGIGGFLAQGIGTSQYHPETMDLDSFYFVQCCSWRCFSSGAENDQ